MSNAVLRHRANRRLSDLRDEDEYGDVVLKQFSEKEARMTDYISPKQFHDSEGVEDWRVVSEGACAFFRNRAVYESARVVRAINPVPGGGGAIHVAIWVPHEHAEARIAAALAAGGRMVRDEFAPSWWTLADASGNEADIATTMGRD